MTNIIKSWNNVTEIDRANLAAINEFANKLSGNFEAPGDSFDDDCIYFDNTGRADEVYEDDANIHIVLDGVRYVIGYDQMSTKQSTLDSVERRATKYFITDRKHLSFRQVKSELEITVKDFVDKTNQNLAAIEKLDDKFAIRQSSYMLTKYFPTELPSEGSWHQDRNELSFRIYADKATRTGREWASITFTLKTQRGQGKHYSFEKKFYVSAIELSERSAHFAGLTLNQAVTKLRETANQMADFKSRRETDRTKAFVEALKTAGITEADLDRLNDMRKAINRNW